MKNKKIKLSIAIIISIIFFIIIFIICKIKIFSKTNLSVEEVVNLKDIDNKVCSVSWNSDSEIVQIKNNYIVSLTLDEITNTYTAKIVINVVNDSEDVWNEIYFRDYPSAFTDKENGKLSEISEIKNERTDKNLEFERLSSDNTVFFIKLDYPLPPNEVASISMEYKAYIPNLNARYGYQIINDNIKDYYLGNCIPILCPYEDGNFIYHPYFAIGECFYSRMANYEVNITIPNDYKIIATGNQISDYKDGQNTTYKYIANASRDFCIIIGNDYNVISKQVDGINISSFYHTGRKSQGEASLNIAISAIDTFNKRLGKYPYDNFSVVELQMEMLGMEYPGMVLITMNEGGVDSTFHEVIHQWFYSLIGNDSYSSAWIDESITTYLANPGLDEHSGIITKPYNYFKTDSDYTFAMYFCGASFYNKLEETYGRKKIDNFMHELLETYSYKEITARELVKLLQKYYGDDNEILKEYIDNDLLI